MAPRPPEALWRQLFDVVAERARAVARNAALESSRRR